MKTNRAFAISFVAVMGIAPLAMAKTPAGAGDASGGDTYVVPLPHQRVLADNVVVGTPAPAPQPAPVVVQPGEPGAAQPVIVEPEPRRKEIIHTDTSPPRNYMGTIAVSALMGGVTGALIGGAIYYLGSQNHPYNIAYWAAGGVLVGTGVGLTQIVVQENRASQATAMFQDPAPTYRLALYHKQF